ncbi:MAG: hypothetical protein P8H88_08555 [Flavobacteriales bacterium]|nr:hypothetical protein [Flavobacteriales bacterium]
MMTTMASVTTWMIVLERLALVAFATVQARFMIVAVRSCLWEIVIAMAINLMRWVYVVAIVWLTLMAMAFATAWMTALEQWTLVAFAMVQAPFTLAAVK